MILKDNEKEKLALMLLNLDSLVSIRKALGVGKNRDIKEICEYNGLMLVNAYKLYEDSRKKEILPDVLPGEEPVTRADFMKLIKVIENTTKDTTHRVIEDSRQNTTNHTTGDFIEVHTIPNVLPNRLCGENYVVKTTSIKVIDNVWKEFKDISKSSTHSSIETLSLALLEFVDKYRSK